MVKQYRRAKGRKPGVVVQRPRDLARDAGHEGSTPEQRTDKTWGVVQRPRIMLEVDAAE